MKNIEYLNEHLLPGQIGHFAVILAFVAAAFSALTYFLSVRKNEDPEWKKFGRIGFFIHSAAVMTVVSTLFYILFSHYFEYKYAFDHLNTEMPMKYIFSCMWEGQEGSFLLWIFWQMVLGLIVLFTAKRWEASVMAIIALVQVFLASMLLGVYFGDFQFGSSPFGLLREATVNIGLPWTQKADYLSLPLFQNGKGLNPLLQNYWMTIHPPTLFLGFASTLIPFAYALAGLWKGERSAWMKPAVPWAFFGVMILGTGILMGGAWAYEALGFGGFWAWDPVENASLVPWLTLVAAAHLLVINTRRETSLFSTLILTLSSFVLVVYSTFLTRSGVLGDSSVHSFVDSGILAQLLVYLLVFVGLSTYLIENTKVWKNIYAAASGILLLVAIGHLATGTFPEPAEGEKVLPGEGTWIPALTLMFIVLSAIYLLVAYNKKYKTKKEDEEELWSREFWMFLGTLVLSLSAIHITFVTSINVWNIFLVPMEGMFNWMHTTFNWEFAKSLAEHNFSAASGDDRFTQFHQVQIPLTIVLLLIIAIGQWLKYKNTETKKFMRSLILSFAAALILTIAFVIFQEKYPLPLGILFFSALWALFANADYAVRIIKGKLNHIGASVAHIGFAMLLLGALISTGNSYFISRNVNGDITQVNKEFKNNEDLLILQGDTLRMGEYFVSFRNKYKEGSHIYAIVDYFEVTPANYTEGAKVKMNGDIFRCKKSHTATDNFLKDWSEDSLWTLVPAPTPDELLATSNWNSGKAGKLIFTQQPSVLMSPKGNSREPDVRHGIGQDLYSYIKYINMQETQGEDGFGESKTGTIQVGEEVLLTESISLILDTLVEVKDLPASLPAGTKAKKGMLYLSEGSKRDSIEVMSVLVKDSLAFPVPDVESTVFNMRFAIQETKEGVDLSVKEGSSNKREMLILSAEVFPMINLLWLGCIVMVAGTVLAIRHRYNLMKKK
ncbi:MAG: cytochrome c biogenesis protein CcsA [Flavobacteriales bacterium]|nr:cytochrome c biogenesis protein CcsA [Flavobacteriales bacterium]MDP4716240.1 cytochrome c biogenesis protein CcsA [Flavobacteriales bacterium]MDP4950701.1 cytochrome c biogenesis protein CcsA [Flavobacteriales bacterium]